MVPEERARSFQNKTGDGLCLNPHGKFVLSPYNLLYLVHNVSFDSTIRYHCVAPM